MRFLNTIWAFDITLTDNGAHAAMIGIELAEKRGKIGMTGLGYKKNSDQEVF